MRALVLSSGGSRGCYHLGVLQYLYEVQNIKHQIICGTSIGAIMGGYLAQYAYGQEALAIANLTRLFEKVKNDDIYKRWRPWGSLSGLFSKPSFYNSTPLRKFIAKNIDPERISEAGKALRVGVTHIHPLWAASTSDNSNYCVYHENHPDLIKAIMASAAFAPFFEPVELQGSFAVDGGTQTVTPIKSAIEAGATVIDVVVCYPTYLTYPRSKNITAASMGLHVIDLMLNRLTWIDIERTLFINKLVKQGQLPHARDVTLNIIHPDVDLAVNSLEFNPKDTARLRQQGWDDAKLVLKY